MGLSYAIEQRLCPAEPTSNTAVEQMMDEEECEDNSPTFQVQAFQWFCQSTKEVKHFRIPAEEQNAGRVVYYFHRVDL